MSKDEQLIYNSGNLVERGRVKEGHRTYSAFHPKEFVHKMVKNAKIIKHIEPKVDNKHAIPQDIWIIGKLN